MNISYLRQYQVAQLPNKYYDFYFEYNGQKFLVELDGEQHFNCTSFYHDVFIHKQHMDRLKTRVAYDFGYKLIRSTIESLVMSGHISYKAFIMINKFIFQHLKCMNILIVQFHLK
jgi:very-short-patch-repair endonuclease